MKISVLATGVVVLGLSLAACGGSDDKAGGSSGDYCKELKSAQKTITGAASSGSIQDSVEAFHRLAAAAPSDVKAEWKVLDGVFINLEKAFKDAKVDLSDSEAAQKAISSGKISPEVLSKMTTPEVTKAQTAIEKHAKKACDINISGS
ncbi:hypothetical protein [Aeromicrobium sp. UC242_57]|uniref:hypothetical protein n=1 Tax=Aeromicrobium sp. UC242_57 TaxID=3374624 RepID=UPI00379E68C3